MQKLIPKNSLNPQNQNNKNEDLKFKQQLKTQFTRFLQNWQQNHQKKYRKIAQKIINQDKHIMLIKTNDFIAFDQELALRVFHNFYRCQHILNITLKQFITIIDKQIDIEIQQQKKKNDPQQAQIIYQVSFDQGFIQANRSIRNLKCQMLGKLKSIVGTVTRVSQVRPELIQGTFQCLYCGKMSQKILQQYKYTTPKKCQGPNCENNRFWELNNAHSIFADFQKIKIQQDASKIPPGSMPRSIQVVLRNQNTQKAQPGDQIQVVGYLNVIPDISSLLKPGERTLLSTRNNFTRSNTSNTGNQGVTGMKGIKQLTYKLCFIGNYVKITNNQFNQNFFQQQQQTQKNQQQQYNQQQLLSRLLNNFTQQQVEQIKRIKQNPRIYDDLPQSLFHQIYGHSEIKKALLLQLLGGVHKSTKNKISIRGDINILIVGDPSTAKSQFLKCVNKFVPRSVYTNGKTTSAAGLTASIVRDQQSGNVSIQAGALLLADNGICCIDQFDKMQIKDQVAIHEAMQQQTISLAKAGVQATLHARTSILAAANPIFGRYNKTQSLRKNLNISPPIMSRFDLYFIICDQVNQQNDHILSSFIVNMHMDSSSNSKINKYRKYNNRQIKNYLTIAKKIKPRLSKQAALQLRESYIALRRRSKQHQQSQYLVTVRQLQSMIRISEGLAKMRLDFQVKSEYVKQAFRLLDCSIVKLEKPTVQLTDDVNITENQKIAMGLAEYLNDDPEKRQKRTRRIVIDQDAFNQIKRNILNLFTQKIKLVNQPLKLANINQFLTQQDVIAYLLTLDQNSGHISGLMQNQRVKKLYTKIIDKLIKQDYLMVLQQSMKPDSRILDIHPNVQLNETIYQMQEQIKNVTPNQDQNRNEMESQQENRGIKEQQQMN